MIPKWQSHKIIEADKIVAVEITNEIGRDPWVWLLACGDRVYVSLALKNRVPVGVQELGGYYVRYADGFESWSPAQPFEEGYTKITPLVGPSCEARAELSAEADVVKGVAGVRGDTYE
jgi:hypothetical protein